MYMMRMDGQWVLITRKESHYELYVSSKPF